MDASSDATSMDATSAEVHKSTSMDATIMDATLPAEPPAAALPLEPPAAALPVEPPAAALPVEPPAAPAAVLEAITGDDLFTGTRDTTDLMATINTIAAALPTAPAGSKFAKPLAPACVAEAIAVANKERLEVSPEQQWALSSRKRKECDGKGASKGQGKGGRGKGKGKPTPSDPGNKRARTIEATNMFIGKGDGDRVLLHIESRFSDEVLELQVKGSQEFDIVGKLGSCKLISNHYADYGL